jgi:hypothetical protein
VSVSVGVDQWVSAELTSAFSSNRMVVKFLTKLPYASIRNVPNFFYSELNLVQIFVSWIGEKVTYVFFPHLAQNIGYR